MADLKISALNSLAGADLVAADVVAVVDNSASETKKLTVSDLIANGVTLISNSTIPSAKILFSAGSIDTAELAASAVETAKINDSAVTAAKLADNSSVTLVSTLPSSGDFIGQIALDTDDNSIVVWNGSAWLSPLASGSVNVVNGSTSGVVNITTSASAGTVTVSATLDDTTAAKQFLAGPTGAGGTVGYRAIASGDLPTATSSAKGAVAVNGNGLTMSNDEIQIDNSVTAETTEHHLVQYDANGLITAGRVIAASDLPEATSSAKGAVVPGSGLSVASGGTLNHTNSATAGTYTKVTVDAQGHVTSAVTLAAADIPDLDAAKITTGTFPTARLADDAVTAAKLADQSVTKFGGAGATDNVVTFPDGDYKGQFFFDEKNEDLYVYTGESFLPITVISGNLVNAGTYDASTNLLSSVTTAGSAAGFTNGAALPAPASGNLNYYVVVDTSGTGSGNAPAVALAPPDMLISLGVAGTTFQLIDVSNAIAGQTAANISVVATGNIAATDVQAALQELDTEKLALAGGTMTGNLELGAGIVIVFEGATDDGFETTLTVADPTADRTITLPNETGTVVTTGSSGVVTSAMITDGTIVNADISASAEIAVSKLANGSARQLLQTDVAGTGVEFTSNVDVPGTFDCAGAGTFDSTLTVTGLISADGKVSFPAGTASAPSFYFGTDTNTGLYHSAADEVAITTGGTQRVVVDSSGQVGIGTSSPGGPLEVQTGIGERIVFDSAGSNQQPRIQLNRDSGADFSIQNALGILEILKGSDDIYRYAGDVHQFHTAGAGERVRIDSSGNLGVGTSAPAALLHIAGTSSPSIRIEDSDNGFDPIEIVATNGGRDTTFRTNQDYYFNQGASTTLMTIQSDGDVGIGVSSPGGNLHVQGAAGASGTFYLTDGDATGVGNSFFIGKSGTATTIKDRQSGSSLIFGTADTERFRVDSSGRLLVGTTTEGSANADNFTVADSGNCGITIRSGITGSGNLYFSDATSGNAEFDGAVVYDQNDRRMMLYTASTERLRIDSSGNVGIGATAPVFGAGSGLEVLRSGVATVRVSSNTQAVELRSDAGTGTLETRGSFALKFGTAGSERARIDSSGRLLVGDTVARSYPNFNGTTVTPLLQVKSSADSEVGLLLRYDSGGAGANRASTLCFQRLVDDTSVPDGRNLGEITFQGEHDGTNTIAAASIRAHVDNASGSNDMPGRLVFSTTADGASSPTERMRITSSGRLLVGSGAAATPLADDGGLDISSNNSAIVIGGSGSGARANNATKDGKIVAAHYTNAEEPVVIVRAISTSTENNLHWGGFTGTSNAATSHRFYTAANNTTTSGTERMRIDSSGNVLVGKTSTSSSVDGVAITASGAVFATRTNSYTGYFNRESDDGQVIVIAQDDTVEGSISVSGTTVSYNGAHLSRWSQLPSGAERTEILRGSVLSNLDEMCEWGDEDNEQLNRMQVSNVEGDRNVSGVFQAWDDDDDTYTNDFYCAMTGDFVIRIAQGTTVARGDLLMSAGDGTAKPQDDDIVRSKTIAKVTSTTVSETYSDGSYCVPCVLMAC